MSKDSKIFGIPIAKNATGSDQMLAHFLEALKVAKEKVDEITPLYDEIRGNYEFVLETVKRMDPSFDPVKFFGKTSKSPLQDKIMTLLEEGEMTPKEVCKALDLEHDNYRSYFSDLFKKPELALGRRSKPTGTTKTFAYATIKWYRENGISDFQTPE